MLEKLLQGKNVIITGARRGIGRAMLELFAENGANIWACGRFQEDGFEEDRKKLSGMHGVWIEPVYFDLSEEEAVRGGIRQIVEEKKPIDVLVNNAGVAFGALSAMTPMAKLKEVFQINYFAQVQIMQMVLRVMKERRTNGDSITIQQYQDCWNRDGCP